MTRAGGSQWFWASNTGRGVRNPDFVTASSATQGSRVSIQGPGFVGAWSCRTNSQGKVLEQLTINGRSYPAERYRELAKDSVRRQGLPDTTASFQKALTAVITAAIDSGRLDLGTPVGQEPSEKRGKVGNTELLVQRPLSDGENYRIYVGQTFRQQPAGPIVARANALRQEDVRRQLPTQHFIEYVYRAAAETL